MPANLRISALFGAQDVQAWFGDWNAARDVSDLSLSLPGSALLRPAGIVIACGRDRRSSGARPRHPTDERSSAL